MANILDGKNLASEIKEKLSSEINALTSSGNRPPGLAVVLVGDDPASRTYIQMKEKACEKIGMQSTTYHFDANVHENELIKLIETLNIDKNVDGILVQVPLPAHINEYTVNSKINPEKDIDGFHPINMGNLFLGKNSFMPCTPKGIIRLLTANNIQIAGKHAVIVGRSNIVGKPMSIMLLQQNATVTTCHSKTKNLKEYIGNADILVVATGHPNLIKGSMIKEGAIVIDAGINRTDQGLVGDVDFSTSNERASWITPVPGGVGPMTIAMLLENTMEAYLKNEN